jgi:hypothetical protein
MPDTLSVAMAMVATVETRRKQREKAMQRPAWKTRFFQACVMIGLLCAAFLVKLVRNEIQSTIKATAVHVHSINVSSRSHK